MTNVLVLCKRSRLDIQPIVAVLCVRVKRLSEADWNKFVQLMKFICITNKIWYNKIKYGKTAMSL